MDKNTIKQRVREKFHGMKFRGTTDMTCSAIDEVIDNLETSGSGGISDAPSDGKAYVRKDAEWVEGVEKSEVDEMGTKVDELDSDLNGSTVDSDIVQVTGANKAFLFPLNLKTGKQYEITISADGVLQPESSGTSNFFPIYANTASSGNLIKEKCYADSKIIFTPDENFTQLCIWVRTSALIIAGGVQVHAVLQEITIKEDLRTIKERIGDLSGLETEEKTTVVGAINEVHEIKTDIYGYMESPGVLISSANMSYSFPMTLKAGNPYEISLSAEDVLAPSSAGVNAYSPIYVNSTSTLLSERTFADSVFTFTPDSDFQKFVLFVRTSSLISSGEVRIIAKDLSSLKERVDRLDPDFNILKTPAIYGRKYSNTSSFLKFNNKIYPEGFCMMSKDKLTINGGREYQPLSYPIEDDTTSNVALKSGVREKEITLQYKNVDPSTLPSAKEFVLCIGESTTASSEKDNDQNQIGPWGWASSVRMFSMMDRADNVGADIVTLGTKSGSTSRSFSYKNETLSIKSCHEGHSGWTSYTFLYYPTIGKLSTSTTRFTPKSLWYVLGLYSKTPYNQSEYNVNIEEYTGSAQQITMITSTPWGKYKMDCHQSVWTIMKALSGNTTDGRTHPIFGDESASYTGSEQQKALMHEWNNALMNAPINPFYSIDEARNGTSGTAFSLETYLSRFRTLDDMGNRLTGSAGESVVGQDGESYTIGTDITSTDAYDVCTPTKVILNVGINDSEGDNTEFNTVENIKTLVGRFDVPTAYFLSRRTGSCNPALWSDVADLRPYSPIVHNAKTLDLLADWFAEQEDKYLLASYAVQHPCSVTGNFNMVDPISGKTILNCKTNNLHPGINAYKSIGFQCLSWLYYVISIEV